MAIIDLNETDLRNLIEDKYNKWQKAENRVNRYGTIKCIGQANKYRYDYAHLLRIAYKKGYDVTEKELNIIKLEAGGI